MPSATCEFPSETAHRKLGSNQERRSLSYGPDIFLFITSVWINDKNLAHPLCLDRVARSEAKLTSEELWPCAGGVMNGQVTGSFPSSVFQVTPGYTPDFWSASASTTHTAFCHHTAKLCPAAGWWSRHRGRRLLREWYNQVRKLTLRVNRAGVTFHVNLKSPAQDYL